MIIAKINMNVDCYYILLLLLAVIIRSLILNVKVLSLMAAMVHNIKKIYVRYCIILTLQYHTIKFAIIIISTLATTVCLAVPPLDLSNIDSLPQTPLPPAMIYAAQHKLFRAHTDMIGKLINRVDNIDDLIMINKIISTYNPTNYNLLSEHEFSEVETTDYSSHDIFSNKLLLFGLCTIGILYLVYFLGPFLWPFFFSMSPSLLEYKKLLYWKLLDLEDSTPQAVMRASIEIHNAYLYMKYGLTDVRL
jgi:hypothetical protein